MKIVAVSVLAITRAGLSPPPVDRGNSFQPFNVPYRDPEVKQLPHAPLELFQIFVPITLVEKWVQYTNRVSSLLEGGVISRIIIFNYYQHCKNGILLPH